MKMKNKIILITGASKGLGRAMAILFSRNHAKVILTARSSKMLDKVKNQIETETSKSPLVIPCDVSSAEDVDRMASLISETYTEIDVLVNNAGFGMFLESGEMTNSEMRRHFEVNFFGTFYCVKALLPLLKNSRTGYVLNIGSFFSRVASGDNSVYAATKFALDGFSKGLRYELKQYGIKVGIFIPGPIDTSFHEARKHSSTQTSKSLMAAPEKVAGKIEQMIVNQKKELIYPFWMFQALRFKLAFL